MSQIDKDIVVAFENLRAFCRHAALMLVTSDGSMIKSGWRKAKGGKVFSATTAIDWPTYWVPTYLARFYTHPAAPEILAFTAIIIGYPKDSALLSEAIVTGGWLNYGTSQPGSSWKLSYARAHLFATGRKDDGTVCLGDLKGVWKGDVPAETTKIATFAFPLSKVTDSALLLANVIDPLMQNLRIETSGRV
jgi:hypothetical protein